MTPKSRSRREFVRTAGTALGASVLLAGCSGDGGDGGGGGGGDANVDVGPGGELRFDPEEVTVSTGETVEWSFESAGHNVSGNPDHHEEVSIPDGAEPFASVDEAMDINEPGSTFSHTFETAGEYTYVCVPHVASGMIGTVVVE